ncbi:MAG: Rieske 2Fe-2S domain-containing protein [Ignavibacteria bacterium]|nr:Rieske 2Fe-2S domain-containing protein [Ignavibacteriota bacterium]
MEKDNFNRRDFLKTSFKSLAVGTIALSALDVKKLFAESAAETKSETESAAKVISISEHPELSSVGGYIITGNYFIKRTGDSKFLVLSIICSHKKCDVDYTGEGFECPCHGSTYSSTGKVLQGPAKKNLKSYKATYDAEKNTLTIN